MASVADVAGALRLGQGRDLVLDAYESFSPELAAVARRFFDEHWIDAPGAAGQAPGGVLRVRPSPSHHPYVLLNWTANRSDVLTLAHELGHGVHAFLAREQGVFHQSTPLTLAETASVFGETVTFGRLLAMHDDPAERLALLAENVEGAIATVFRQTAMNRFEELVHTERRTVGELAVDALQRAVGGEPDRAVRRLGRDHRGLPHVVVVHPALHRGPGLRLRLRLRPTARHVGVRPLRGAGPVVRAPLPRHAGVRRVPLPGGAGPPRRLRSRRPRRSGTAACT